MGFNELGLSDAVVHGVQSMGFVDPTPIQLRAIPVILSGKDLMGSAQTGTGKTAAFGLPILSKLGSHQEKPRCLVLEPTRELAMQVETAFRDYGRFSDLTVTLLYGGVGYGKQREELQRGTDIIVATPGRLLDFMEQNEVPLGGLEFLVLEEVDRMLDMGFLPQVRRVIQKLPKNRQTLFFSATMPSEIESLAKFAVNDPEKIEIGIRMSPAETITHAFYPVAMDQKYELLSGLMEKTNFDCVLVFCRTKDGADRIARQLKKENHSVVALHSNRTQREREEALEGFKNGRYEVLVATDIAARGLDIAGVSHVINYDIPGHPEDYVHRIGRTGRAQAVGDAFTLVTAEDLAMIESIERFIGMKIPRLKLDGFDYKYTTLLDPAATHVKARAAGGGRHRSGYSFGIKRRR